MLAPPEAQCRFVTEIEIEDIGIYRLCNAWELNRARNVRGKENRRIALICFGAGMSVRQFKHLPPAKQDEMRRAYLALLRSRTLPTAA